MVSFSFFSSFSVPASETNQQPPLHFTSLKMNHNIIVLTARRAALCSHKPISIPAPARRAFSAVLPRCTTSQLTPTTKSSDADAAALRNENASVYLGTTKRLPEFNLIDRVVLVSGAARGLGLVQAEALLEAGATGIYPPCCSFVSIFPELELAKSDGLLEMV